MSVVTERPVSSPERGLDRRAWQIIGVATLAPFMTQMDSTIVNVSLSTIREDLHSSIARAQWIISGYLLALALMLPLHGWLVDRLGAKRLYLFCFSLFTLASVLCGMAHSMPELICARIVQGIAGGLLAPLAQLMVARVAGKQMARVMGYAAVPILIAPLVGPVLAGMILKYAGWPMLFYVNLPVGILSIFLAALVIPHDERMIQRRPLDIAGFLMISPGLSFLLFGFEQVSHHEGSSFLVLGLVLLGAFLVYARGRKEKALIDIELFKIRTFSAATTTQFLAYGIIYAGQFLIPYYLISGAGLSATQAGWMLSAMGIGMLFTYPAIGHLTDKFGCRAVSVTGVLVNFLGTLPFLWMSHAELSIPLAVAGLLMRGVGQGATGIPTIAAAYASVPTEKLSLATTTINIVQRLGGPILTTMVAIVVSLSQKTHGAAVSHAFFIPFVALVAFQLLVILAAIRLPAQIHQK